MKLANGQSRWVVGVEQSMRDWLDANMRSDEQEGDKFVPPPDFGTYLSTRRPHAPHFSKMPFQRPVLFGLSKAQSDELGYTVPAVIDVPYMDRSALDDDTLRRKMEAIDEASGRVVLATGTNVSVGDFYNAQALRRRFDSIGLFNTYPRYHGRPSYHILVQCSMSCNQVDAVHGLLVHVFEGLEVDGQAVAVTKAHSRNTSCSSADEYGGGMTKERRNRKGLNDFKNARFGVMVVCEMFVQGADFPELDAVLSWNANFDNEMATVQLGGRSSRKVKGGSKEMYSFLTGIQYLDDDSDGDRNDGDDDEVTPESLYARLTKDGFALYEQLARAFGEDVKFRVRYTKKKKKKKMMMNTDAGYEEVDEDDDGRRYETTTFSELDMKKIRELVHTERFDKYVRLPLSEKLERWKAEMREDGVWKRSTNGKRPPKVINGDGALSTRPYQVKVSRMVGKFLDKRITKKAWDDYAEDHDLRVFAAFVLRELGWDFKAEWLKKKEKKQKHDPERETNRTPKVKETFSENLEGWKAEMLLDGVWKQSTDGKRPPKVINEKASAKDRPYQWKASKMMHNFLSKRNTKKTWDDYAEDHDLRVFAAFVWMELGWDFKAEWLKMKEKHDAQRRDNTTPKETFSDELEGESANGRPYQWKVSRKVGYLLGKTVTKKAWDDYAEDHDLRVFAAFVWMELGWDFKAEWLQRKDQHEAKRDNPPPTFSEKLELWKAEMQLDGVWKRSKDGKRPPKVINLLASAKDRPYQRMVSNKVRSPFLDKRCTKKAWDDYAEDHDLHVFAAFVLRELGWDFKAEWLQRKAEHEETKRPPCPPARAPTPKKRKASEENDSE